MRIPALAIFGDICGFDSRSGHGPDLQQEISSIACNSISGTAPEHRV